MSDPAAAARTRETHNGRTDFFPLTPDRVDAVLADFRVWLVELSEPPIESNPTPVFDLSTITAQVAALRHEVHLQTKVSRAAVEHSAESLKAMSASKSSDSGGEIKPLVNVLIDIADAMAMSVNHVEKIKGTLGNISEEIRPHRPRLLARLFGGSPPKPDADALGRVRELATGISDGYSMSLRRIERALPGVGLERIECLGQPFDPELMEVVNTVDDPDQPSGTVVAEVRRGYLWHGKPFRFAEVTVTR